MFGAFLAVVALTAQPEFERVATAADAVGWAVADIALVAEIDRPFFRYLWVPPQGSAEWHKINSFAVNAAVSRAGTIQLPDGAAGGWLIRWDLRRLAPKSVDLIRLIQVWDSLADADPYFHLQAKVIRVPVAPYRASDGRTYDFKLINGTIAAPHLAEQHAILEGFTRTRAPILRADWFTIKALTTLEGGRYYDFMGFKQGNRRLSEREILESIGADTALSRRVDGADRVGMFESGVTEKARTVESGQGAVGNWWITFDIFDEDAGAENHPIYNLLDIVDKARGKEIIFELPNGMHGFILVDGKGTLVDEAPFNLASDKEVPRSATKRLQPAIGCIRCHGGDDGLRPAQNDVAKLLSGRLDLFDDLGNLKATRFENVEKLAGFYAGTNFNKRLRLGRDSYSEAVFTATRGLDVSAVSSGVSEMQSAYRYSLVTPDAAALELGFKVKPGEGSVVLRASVPDLRAGGVIVDGKSLSVADPSIAALLQGMEIRRVDFERVFPDMSLQIEKGKKK